MPELNKTILKNSANLKAYYRFEGNSTDSSASGLNGTDTAITYGTSYGYYDQGANFVAASNSKISLGTSNTLNLTGSMSINVWIKPSALNAYQIIFYRGSSAGYQLEINNANNTFFFSARGGNTATAPTNSLTAGVWQMVTMSKSGTNVSLYVNGKFLNTTASITVSSDSGQAAIIGQNGSNGDKYNGDMDDLAIFDTALSADQIKELYEGRYLGELRPNQFGTTAALYHLSSTTDAGGNNYHLTNTNTVGFVAGRFGNCADFGSSNTNKQLSVADPMSINGGAISVSLWVKAQTEIGSGAYGFFIHGNNTSQTAYGVNYEYNSGTRRLGFFRTQYAVGKTQGNYTTTLGTTSWHHIVLTYDTTNIGGYLNGSLVVTQAASGNGGGTYLNGLILGSENGANYSSVFMDEVHVSSTALTANQIRQIYALGVGKYY
jgi:hypothetical protein